MEVFGAVAEQALGDARVLFESGAILGRGLQHWQRTYMGAAEQALSDLERTRQGFIRCGSAWEIAELQRAASLDLMARAVTSNVALLHIAVQSATTTSGPFRGREDMKRRP